MKTKINYSQFIKTAATSLLLLLIVLSVTFIICINNRWKKYYSEAEMRTISHQINTSEKMPENFYKAYEIVYGQQINIGVKKSIANQLFNKLLNSNKYKWRCSCMLAASTFHNNSIPLNYHGWRTIILALGIENFSKPQKCLDFYYKRIGMDSLSHDIFNKQLYDFSTEEMISIINKLE